MVDGARPQPLPRTGYDWLHPSWRDLIIDHLATNATARRAFLASCTSQGILLALSHAGGREGERAFPLAREKGDWDHIRIAVCRILESEDQASVSTVLAGLVSAFEPDSVQAGQCPPNSEDVKRITHAALEACRGRWQAESVVLDVNTLESYYRLSVAHAPLVGSPDLTETWNMRWVAAEGEFRKDVEDRDIEVAGVKRWAQLAALLADNEPRFLRFHRFPDRFIAPIEGFLKRVACYVDNGREPDTEDEYQHEIAHLDYIREAVCLLGQILPDIEGAATEVEKELACRSSTLTEECWEQFPDAEPDNEPEDVYPSGRFDIEEFFADL